MSGPKRYRISYSTSLMRLISQRRESETAKRAAQTRSRLDLERKKAANLLASTRRQSRQALEAQQKQLAADAAVQRENANRSETEDLVGSNLDRQAPQSAGVISSADGNASASGGVETNALTADQVQASTNAAAEAAATAPGDEKVISEVGNLLESLLAWQPVLAEDTAVRDFNATAAQEWVAKAQAVVSTANDDVDPHSQLQKSQTLLAEAEQIHQKAGELQAKFVTRNELLQDMIASLQQIGFFVSDPVLENPADPAGLVRLTASRGSENVTASIDLAETVQSIWNGIEAENCKSTFFQYVDQMKSRGLEVQPDRDDLRDRPALKQKGEMVIPQCESKTR